MESSKQLQLTLTIALSVVCMSMSAQSQIGTATITFQEQKAETTISRHIYGHFSEHLGHCIYDGLWVGKDSEIPTSMVCERTFLTLSSKSVSPT